MQTTTEVNPLINFTERLRTITRKKIDKAYQIIRRLDQLTGDVPVYYSIVSAKDSSNNINNIQKVINYYIHNTNNNSLILVSSKMIDRDTFLIATIGKPLPLPDHMPLMEKVIRTVDPYIRIGNYNLTLDNFDDAIVDLMLNSHVRIAHDFNDYNSKLIITYSRLIYHDRNDFNFNVDNDYNHYRLLDVEKLLLKCIK